MPRGESTPSAGGQLIHEVFEAQVARAPDQLAMCWGDVRLTYAQLNNRANQIAHALLEHGIRPDDKIGLFVDRSLESVVGMLAILKAGAAYVPLDPAYPMQRLSHVREDSSLAVLLTTSTLRNRIVAADVPVIQLDGESPHSTANPNRPDLRPRHLAYVIYTSGSTGKPKGVMVEHRNVLALINGDFAPISSSDCVAHCANPSFDATTWEVWAALLNGARLLIVPQSIVLDPIALNRTLVQHSVTAMWLTVGLFNEYVDILDEAFGGLNYLLVGGDALVPSLVARALRKERTPRHFLNGYGPTETTTFATTFEVTSVADDATSIPIGQPLANARIHILNDQLQPVPPGEPGQICIGGAGVSRGYLNQPELTNERFVADPFADSSDAQLYLSGDQGRHRLDGNIEFLGRNDLQVKIRGFRIELGEVESAVLGFPGIKQVVSVAQEEAPGVKRLISYVVLDLRHPDILQLATPGDSREQITNTALQRLRVSLEYRLPPHMVPAVIVPMDELPLTVNGKIDRRNLPSPEGRQYLPLGYVAADTPTEEALSNIWKQALKVTQVGVHDNFFELGGDSLMGIEMVGQVTEHLRVELPFMAVFQYPTVRQLAGFIDELRGCTAAVSA